jgi:hypothetical protein
VDVQAPGVVALRHPAELLAQQLVVLGVDDPLLEVVGPGVGAHGGQAQPLRLGEGEESPAVLALHALGLREGLAAARADLYLGVDQLAAHGIGEHLVVLARLEELLEAVLELQRRRVDDCELLLQPDREVGRLFESGADPVEVQAVILRLGVVHVGQGQAR